MGKGGARLVTTRARDFRSSSAVPPEQLGNSLVAGSREHAPGSGPPLDGSAGQGSIFDGNSDSKADGLRASLVAVAADDGADDALGCCRPSRVERFNKVVYLACCLVFMPGSLGFLPELSEYEEAAVWSFIVGSVGFMWVSCWDARETLAEHRKSGEELPQFINCCLYASGSGMFLLGSFLFLPGASLTSLRIATWLFIVGSVVFTLAAFLNVTEVRRDTPVQVERHKLVITLLYAFGGLIFVIGSVFFLPGLKSCSCVEPAGAWLFFVGSGFYAAGACLNFRTFPPPDPGDDVVIVVEGNMLSQFVG